MTLLTIERDELTAPLITPEQLQEEIPLTNEQLKFILNSRQEIEAILDRKDPRILLIVGPCSIHDMEAAYEYGLLFKRLSDLVSNRFLMIMRTYFEKPRTTIGWKGMLYDPDLDGSYEMQKGVRLTRKLASDLTNMKIPLGSEILEMTTSHYYTDYLSWGCIGARTSASPPHRQMASSLEMPIGFKNTVDGNIDTPIQGIISANSPHVFLGVGQNGQLSRIDTAGNPYCHIILRGSENGPNYAPQNIASTLMKCQKSRVRDSLVIDCSHDNSTKIAANQVPVFESIIDQIESGNRQIVGAMLESYICEGSQLISDDLEYGVSITDPCLDWKTTERVILSAYKRLMPERFLSFSVR